MAQNKNAPIERTIRDIPVPLFMTPIPRMLNLPLK